MTTDERALATWLSARSDAELAETFALRSVPPGASWHDFFDAAEALLDAASLDRALTRLPRAALTQLAAGSASTQRAALERLALVDGEGQPYSGVADRVALLRRASPTAFQEPEEEAAAPEPANASAAAAAAERILGATGALADLLIAAEHDPLARTGAGAVSAADRKRLTDAGAVASPEELDDLVRAAHHAGLLDGADREWLMSDAGAAWLESTTTARWSTVVEGFRRALRPGLRTASGGYAPPSTWPDAYPLDPDWPQTAEALRRIAERWGLLTPEGAEPAWATPLRSGTEPGTDALAALLPPEIDRIYLQADLSAIAPGPLAPPLDLRLRRIAVRESRAQASTYRFTGESIAAGMTEGESAASIRDFLSRLSLTGIPQPLDYLLTSVAARHGLVKVRAGDDGNTWVESDDRSVSASIEVDQALRPLGLVAHRGSLVTRVARDIAYWALADARYPVVAVDPAGAPETVSRRPVTASSAAGDRDASYSPLVARLRDAEGSDSDAAWLGRELEQAVRSRSLIDVAVRLPDGTERTFTLEATGLGGGRLRGRDRGADIERTLPVSSIVSVRPV